MKGACLKETLLFWFLLLGERKMLLLSTGDCKFDVGAVFYMKTRSLATRSSGESERGVRQTHDNNTMETVRHAIPAPLPR